MKQIFISSVQKEFERERAAIKRMIETDPIIKPHFKTFVFEIDAPAADKTTRQVYLEEIEKSDVYLLLVGDKYGCCEEGSVSPTEQEYDKAVESGKTKLVMVRGTDNSKREEREAKFLNKVSDGRVRVRYQNSESGDALGDLLDEVRNSIRDLMIDEGILSEIPYEDQSPSDVSWDEIDDARVRWFVRTAIENRKADYKPDMSVEDVLRSLHLLNRRTWLPTNAALLLFGKDVQDRFPSSLVKCVSFFGTEKEKPSEDAIQLEGDVFRVADGAVSFIRKHLNNGVGERVNGASADDVQEIPNSVIAEAVNNAVAHRNYSSNGSVQVEVYRDRVEIINPGRLHFSMTVADLYKKHESLPPNLRIAHAMYYAKYIEELGTGITELLKKCRRHGLKRPLLEESSGKFRIVLWRRVKKVGRAESLRFELQVVEYLRSVGGNGAKLSDLQQFAGDLPRGTCQSSLRKLRKEGKIRMEGSTSAAKWFFVYQ